jgi:hypothetical protein
MLDNRLLDFVVIALYFAVMIGAGYWGLRRARSADDYLVAGRRLGPFMYVGTLSAVVLGGASTIGGIALGYANGISGMWLDFWIGMGVIALGILMSTRLSRLGVYTVSEMLENRLDLGAAVDRVWSRTRELPDRTPDSNRSPTASECPPDTGKEMAEMDIGADVRPGPSDTTFDTTQSATHRNSGQPSAKKSA